MRKEETCRHSEIRIKYQEKVAKGISSKVTMHMSVDQSVPILNDIIKQAIETVVPLAEQPKTKWISEKTLALAKEKREMRGTVHESLIAS